MLSKHISIDASILMNSMQTIHSQDNEYFIKKTPKLFIFEIGTIQRGAVKKFFRRCLRKNLNCRQYINGKHMIFFRKQKFRYIAEYS